MVIDTRFIAPVMGKLFGGAFGFMVGGPLGALLGAAVGHNFDHSLWKIGVTADTSAQPDPMQTIFLRTAFQLMGYIAKADGRVSEKEIAMARAIMAHLHLDTDQQRTAIACFTAGKQADFALAPAIDTFQKGCPRQFALLQQLLEIQLHIAYADGPTLHPDTHRRLLSLAERLGVSRGQFERLHQALRAHLHTQQPGQQHDERAGNDQSYQHRSHGPRPATAVHSLSQAYKVLGLQRHASLDEIKLAYRRLIKQHHPDKLSATGASMAEMKRATEKTREITAAYERIREARGF